MCPKAHKSLAKLEAVELTTTSDCATGGSRVARRDTAMSSDQQHTDDAVLVREAKAGNPKARAEVFRRLAAGDRSSELLTFPRWYFRAAREHEKLIEKAEGGGAEAAGAAEKLLAAFIGGGRGPPLPHYIFPCPPADPRGGG